MENPNPNYDERLRPKSWSDLPPDLLISVFERLTFGNFQRAKSVCSSWYSASRQSVPKNQIPWLILFPEDDDNNNNNYSCTLFNPEVKHKLYKTQDLGVEFAKSVCMVTYGSCWLLMRDPLHNIYIMNLFTHERINLPPVQILWKDYELHLPSHLRTRFGGIIRLRSPVFWIDEKTKDYVVVCGLRDWCVVYSKKGDTSWNQIPQTSYCSDMVYKDHKLYFLSYNYRVGIFKIFDFSEEIPQQTFQCYVRVEIFHKCRQLHQPSNRWSIYATQLVVTVTGEVLKVEKWWRHRDITWSFRVFKIYSSGIIKKPERIYSLGDELMLFDQGITVLANDNDGFIRNSIYFNARNEKNTNDILIFDLETRKTESLLYTLFDTSSIQFSRAQWFLPSFTHT